MGTDNKNLLGPFPLKNRKGQISRFGYDRLNRRISSIFDDGSKTEYVYDAGGRLTNITDTVSGPISFAYDNLDRLTSEATPLGIISYSYDPIGRRTSMSANGGQQPITYSYDAASRLTHVAQGTQIVGLGYNGAGRRTSLTYPNGVQTSYTYDNASRLLSIEHLNPTTQQLIEGLSYTYDAAGNRISFTRTSPQAPLPAPVQAAYDAANEMLTRNSELGTQNLTYDANGNLTSELRTQNSELITYTWDAKNRLVGLNRSVIASNSEAISASFTYDALGRRASKTINGITTEYIYDGNDIISEISGGVVGATYLRSLNIDEPFIRQSSTNEYYHTDALGSVLGLTTENGQLATTYSYDSFGNTTMTGTSTNPFQYTGRENDGTGLYYYRARYYSPGLQRFVSEDPLNISLAQIIKQNAQLSRFGRRLMGRILYDPLFQNLYPYVRHNPLKFRDPSGLKADGSVIFVAPYDDAFPQLPPEIDPTPTPEEDIINAANTLEEIYNAGFDLIKIITEHALDAIIQHFLRVEIIFLKDTLEPPPAEAKELPMPPPVPPPGPPPPVPPLPPCGRKC